MRTKRFPGKEKAHKHKQICPVTAWVREGGWPGVRCLCAVAVYAEPKEHKHFCPGTQPGGPVTGVTEKLFMCQMFMCLFWPLIFDISPFCYGAAPTALLHRPSPDSPPSYPSNQEHGWGIWFCDLTSSNRPPPPPAKHPEQPPSRGADFGVDFGRF